MKWYKPVPDGDTYDYLRLINRSDLSLYSEVKTQYYRHGVYKPWKALDVEVVSNGNPCDFYSFVANDLVLTDHSWQIMRLLVGQAVEDLTLICPALETRFHFLKAIDRVDCLDYEKSLYQPTTAEMLSVQSYSFREDMIEGKNIFFLLRAHHIVVSQVFKDAVDESNLKGLIFQNLG
jgi:hypothetical protein